MSIGLRREKKRDKKSGISIPGRPSFLALVNLATIAVLTALRKLKVDL